jgi:hypothetical protein
VQLCDWVMKHGLTTPVSDITPIPLTPGTAKAGSGECFTCGQVGHNGACGGCPSKGKPGQVPQKETDWRHIIWINFHRNLHLPPGTAASTFYVAYDDPFAMAAAELVEQGKGEGSTAWCARS